MTVIIAAIPNNAKFVPIEKSLGLFLDTGALTPTVPASGAAKTAPMINATVGATVPALCNPPTVNQTVAPGTPAVNQAVTVSNAAVTTTVTVGQTAPVGVTESTNVRQTPIPSQNCPNLWGGWKPSANLKTIKSPPPGVNDANAVNYPDSTRKYLESSLHLWLTSNQNVSVLSFQAKVCKNTAICPGGATMTFTFDLQGTNGVCPASGVETTPGCFTGQTVHTDPATGLPALLIGKNDSVPVTLTAVSGTEAEYTTSDKLVLVFDNVRTVGTNNTSPVDGKPLPQNALGMLLIQYGSAEKASGLSLQLHPTSAYSNSKSVGLWLNDLNGDRYLDYAYPKTGVAARSFSTPVELGDLPADPGLPVAKPVLLAQGASDNEYIVRGNAIVKIFYTVEPINAEVAGLKKSPTAFLAEVRFEVNLTIGDKVIKSNVGSLRAGLDYHRTSTDTGIQPYGKKVVAYALPTAGLFIGAGVPIKLSATVQGSDVAGKLFIWYGSTEFPTGAKIPMTLATPEVVVTGLSVNAGGATNAAAGAGLRNGNFSLYVDHASARVHAGGSAFFVLTVKNQNRTAVPFALDVKGPRNQRVTVDPVSGTVGSQQTAQSLMTVTIQPASLLGLNKFTVNATFNRTTVVGPLEITVIVDLLTDAAGNLVFPSGAGPGGEAEASAQAGKAKQISGAKVPGFELFVLVAALVVGFALARRRP